MTPEDRSELLNDNKTSSQEGYTLSLGDGTEYAEFDPSLWRLTVFHTLGSSRIISLGYAEACILDFFVKHPGKIITRQELIDFAWKDRVVSQGSLNQAVSILRSILGDDQKREIIITVPRRGYQLNAESLMQWSEWQAVKQNIVAPKPSSPEIRPPLFPNNTSHHPIDIKKYLHEPAVLWIVSVALLATLIWGGISRYYFTLYPPYAVQQVNDKNTRLTIVAKDEQDLNFTLELLKPAIKQIEVLGGGRALISKNNNNIEFNCIRPDNTVHSLLVHIKLAASISSANLRECLK